jgi:hypothetical protein
MSLSNLGASAWIQAAGIALLVTLAANPGCGAPDPLRPENPEQLTIQIRTPAFMEGRTCMRSRQ